MLLSLDRRRRRRGPSSAGNDGFIRPEVCRSVQMYTQGYGCEECDLNGKGIVLLAKNGHPGKGQEMSGG